MPGHALEEAVAAGEEAHDEALDGAVLADDDLLDLEQRGLEALGIVGGGAGRVHGRRRLGPARRPDSGVTVPLLLGLLLVELRPPPAGGASSSSALVAALRRHPRGAAASSSSRARRRSRRPPGLEEPITEAARGRRRPGHSSSRPAVDAVAEAAVRPRFRDRLGKARGVFAGFLGRTTIDEATWEELEDALILADVGAGLTGDLLDHAAGRGEGAGHRPTRPGCATALEAELKARLAADRVAAPRRRRHQRVALRRRQRRRQDHHHRQGRRRRMTDDGAPVVMAAGDTFRAAAAEQLGTWAERAGAHFVRGGEGADPSSVIFDAVESARRPGRRRSCSPTPPAASTPSPT